MREVLEHRIDVDHSLIENRRAVVMTMKMERRSRDLLDRCKSVCLYDDDEEYLSYVGRKRERERR